MDFRSSFWRCRWTPDLSVTWVQTPRMRVLPVTSAARLCDNAGFRFCRTHVLNTAVVGSSRDFSLHVATGSNRPCCTVPPDDSARLLMFWVHSLYIANCCDTSTHLHVRVTSVVRCCLAAPSGDRVCPRIFLTRGFHLAVHVWEGMSGSGQFNVLLVNASFMDSTLCRETRNSNFTVSALPDCVRLKGLELVSATFRNECFVVMPSS